jgi:hypothetical protein
MQSMLDSKDEIIAQQRLELANLKSQNSQLLRQERSSLSGAIPSKEADVTPVNASTSPKTSETTTKNTKMTQVTTKVASSTSVLKKNVSTPLSKLKKPSVSSPRLSMAPSPASGNSTLMRKVMERAVSVRSLNTGK